MQLEPEFMKKYVDSYNTEELSDCLYKANFLESFHLREFNEEVINREIYWLYQLLVDQPQFKECMRKMANSYMSKDLMVGFMLLFSYDFFFLMHLCVCECLKQEDLVTLPKLEAYIEEKLSKKPEEEQIS